MGLNDSLADAEADAKRLEIGLVAVLEDRFNSAFNWWRCPGLNGGPAAYESAALPTELHRQSFRTRLPRTRQDASLSQVHPPTPARQDGRFSRGLARAGTSIKRAGYSISPVSLLHPPTLGSFRGLIPRQ
jgi:hypothetical protein